MLLEPRPEFAEMPPLQQLIVAVPSFLLSGKLGLHIMEHFLVLPMVGLPDLSYLFP
jgi:hypothetical protein